MADLVLRHVIEADDRLTPALAAIEERLASFAEAMAAAFSPTQAGIDTAALALEDVAASSGKAAEAIGGEATAATEAFSASVESATGSAVTGMGEVQGAAGEVATATVAAGQEGAAGLGALSDGVGGVTIHFNTAADAADFFREKSKAAADDATFSFTELNQSLELLEKGFHAITGAISGLFHGATDLVRAFGEDQAATIRFSNALELQGPITQELIGDYRNLAAIIGERFAFSGDAIERMGARVIAFGRLTREQTGSAIQAVATFARATETDLDSAGAQFGRVFARINDAVEGEQITLGRTGLAFRATGDAARDFATFVELAGGRFTKTAIEMAQGATAQFDRIADKWEDLKEDLGGKLFDAPATQALFKAVQDAIDDLIGAVHNLTATDIKEWVNGFIGVMTIAGSTVLALARGVDFLSSKLIDVANLPTTFKLDNVITELKAVTNEAVALDDQIAQVKATIADLSSAPDPWGAQKASITEQTVVLNALIEQVDRLKVRSRELEAEATGLEDALLPAVNAQRFLESIDDALMKAQTQITNFRVSMADDFQGPPAPRDLIGDMQGPPMFDVEASRAAVDGYGAAGSASVDYSRKVEDARQRQLAFNDALGQMNLRAAVPFRNVSADFISDVLKGEKGFRDAFSDLGRNLKNSFIDSFTEGLTDQLFKGLGLDTIAGQLFGGGIKTEQGGIAGGTMGAVPKLFGGLFGRDSEDVAAPLKDAGADLTSAAADVAKGGKDVTAAASKGVSTASTTISSSTTNILISLLTPMTAGQVTIGSSILTPIITLGTVMESAAATVFSAITFMVIPVVGQVSAPTAIAVIVGICGLILTAAYGVAVAVAEEVNIAAVAVTIPTAFVINLEGVRVMGVAGVVQGILITSLDEAKFSSVVGGVFIAHISNAEFTGQVIGAPGGGGGGGGLFGKIGGKIRDKLGFAEGGITTSPIFSLNVAGERGREVIAPLSQLPGLLFPMFARLFEQAITLNVTMPAVRGIPAMHGPGVTTPRMTTPGESLSRNAFDEATMRRPGGGIGATINKIEINLQVDSSVFDDEAQARKLGERVTTLLGERISRSLKARGIPVDQPSGVVVDSSSLLFHRKRRKDNV